MGVYKGVTTSELDELAAETAANLSSVHPDYGQVWAGRHAAATGQCRGQTDRSARCDSLAFVMEGRFVSPDFSCSWGLSTCAPY